MFGDKNLRVNNESDIKWVPVRIPFCSKAKNNITNKINNFVRKFIKLKQIRVSIIFYNNNNFNNWINLDRHSNHIDVSNVVYEFKCGNEMCPANYIGETCRRLCDRIKEHIKGNIKPVSAIFKHYSEKAHKCTENNFSILRKCTNNEERLIWESLLIKINNPTLNFKQLTRKLFTIP